MKCMKLKSKNIIHIFPLIFSVASLIASFIYRNPLFAICGFLSAIYVQREGKDILLKNYNNRVEKKREDLLARRR